MDRKRIFISHISKETDLAQCLKEQLSRDFPDMLDIFVSSDRDSIKVGDKWLSQVDEALAHAGILIVLCSKESVVRPWVNFEAGAAWIRKIPVIPICHTGITTRDLPSPLSMLQGISGNDEDGLKKLYDRVADYLRVSTPVADFAGFAGKIKAIEEEFLGNSRAVELIRNPKILCAASKVYTDKKFGFDLDVAVLESAFPGCVQVERGLTRKRLFQLLTTQQFDIIHLVAGVDERNGNLVFEGKDYAEGSSAYSAEMSPDSFAHLLTEANTRLVVLATCNALLLAVEVARVANMAASDKLLTGVEAEAWAESFYGLLASGKTLFKAFEITRQHLETIPIRAIRHRDVAFSE